MKRIGMYIFVIVVCIVAICSGIYCGISWFKTAHSESHIIGSLNIDNSYTQQSFTFSNAKHPIVFYHDDYDANDLYCYSEELESVPSFDGSKKQYEIALNDYLILEPNILFRAISFRVPIIFKDLDGSLLCDTYFDVVIKFYTDKTKFEISVTGNENHQFIERYIQANGFELFVMEVTK